MDTSYTSAVKVKGKLFLMRLDQILNSKHPLYRLAEAINWKSFGTDFGKLYSEEQRHPAKPTRLMVGLQYLKHTFDLSDEEVVSQWVENPYWQCQKGILLKLGGYQIELSLYISTLISPLPSLFSTLRLKVQAE